MARQLVPTVNCDRCGEGLDPSHQSDEVVQTIGLVRRFMVAELCEVCRADLRQTLAQLETDYGFRVETTEKVSDPSKLVPAMRKRKASGAKQKTDGNSDPRMPEEFRTCTECGFVSVTRNALGLHGRKKHGRGLAYVAKPLP